MKPFPELIRVSPHIEIFLFQRECIRLYKGDQLPVLFGIGKDILEIDLPKVSGFVPLVRNPNINLQYIILGLDPHIIFVYGVQIPGLSAFIDLLRPLQIVQLLPG